MSDLEWEELCMRYRGKVLTGVHAHACWDWDDLPIDETCPEWPCICASELIAHRLGHKQAAEGFGPDDYPTDYTDAERDAWQRGWDEYQESKK